ncbi:MAG: outer membrane protein transport protein [Bacteroidales bacterium]|nr:outer membrane protein transport protein [Bacteroidales bacterium]
MKKILLTTFLVGCFSIAFSEGYQVNLQSTKQAAMGHVGTAMKLGAESMHFNPAGLVFMDKAVDLSAGASFIFSKVDYTSVDKKYSASTESNPSTPLYLYAGFKIYDNLAAGISLTNPYGSGLVWPANWNGAHLVQDISLKVFSIQPTVSYKILDRLSIGAGLMIYAGNVSISRALIPVGWGTLGMVPQLQPLAQAYPGVVPAQAALTGTAKVGLGYNVGVMFDINDQWTIGASYRSKVKMKVEQGTAEVNYANETIRQAISPLMPKLDQGTFSASMPMPANLNIGLSYKPINKLVLSADFQYVFWKAYKELNIDFSPEELSSNNISSVKNYSNSFAVRLGGQYTITSRFDVRLGLYYDKTPVNDEYYNPETPGTDKLGFTTGFSFCPIRNFSIDVAFSYVHGLKKNDVSCPAGNSFVLPGNEYFTGDYKARAFIPAIGLSYKF